MKKLIYENTMEIGRKKFSYLTLVIKLLWVICCVVIMLFAILFHDIKDSDIVLIYGMLFLSFPISLLVLAFFSFLILLQEITGVFFLDIISSNIVGTVVIWFTLFIFGYFQWFLLLPRVYFKIKTHIK